MKYQALNFINSFFQSNISKINFCTGWQILCFNHSWWFCSIMWVFCVLIPKYINKDKFNFCNFIFFSVILLFFLIFVLIDDYKNNILQIIFCNWFVWGWDNIILQNLAKNSITHVGKSIQIWITEVNEPYFPPLK